MRVQIAPFPEALRTNTFAVRRLARDLADGYGVPSERCEALLRAICHLDEPYREAILLRYFEGLSLAQISIMLNVPVATVLERLDTALARLRKSLPVQRLRRGDGILAAATRFGRVALGLARKAALGSFLT
jgi:DNA-directed RNA polymerase specialized sigma24 family protein